MFDLKCDECGEVYHIDEQHIGKKFECKRCKHLITISKPIITTEPKTIRNITKKNWDIIQSKVINRFLYNFRYHRSFRNLLILVVLPIIIVGIVVTITMVNNKKEVKSNNKADYQHIVINPLDSQAEANKPDFYLANGTVVFSAVHVAGHGELKVRNGTNSDAVVKLVEEKSLIESVYIRKMNEVSLKHISPGIYQIYFCFGLNWDVNQKRFSRDCSYSKFDDQFYFEETNGKYTVYTITLNPVLNGTATTEPISRDEFERFE